MLGIFNFFLLIFFSHFVASDPSPSLSYNYRNVNDELYEQPVTFMGSKSLPDGNVKDDVYEQAVNFIPSKSPHAKDTTDESATEAKSDFWPPFNFDKIDEYMKTYNLDDSPEHNRVKRKARRRSRGGKRRNGRTRVTTTGPDEEGKNKSSTEVPIARSGVDPDAARRHKKNKKKKNYDTYESPMKNYESSFVEMPKDLYQAHLRPGVIFRIHMSEAILKMQYRNYGEDKDESVIEADVEYLRLTRKVINDEITKFEDLQWLNSWFMNRSELIQEHMCNTRYFAVGTPPTMFTHPEEYMKRLCLFDGIYIDHIPYVVGEDSSLMAAVAPPVLHCDAATCTSVPFIDSVMFDERFSRTNVRTLTRCQASCRAHCRNDPDCLKRCSDRCLRAD